MSGKKTLLTSFQLANTKKGIIAVSHVEEPYGANSNPVVSIGISLKGNEEESDWKAHIPYENLDELIKALENAKKTYNS